jgi:hypothetical protein
MEKEKIEVHKESVFELTPNQKKTFQHFQKFIADDNLKVFILKGYAEPAKPADPIFH